MGQKVNPHGLRVGVIKNWDSRWFVSKKEFGDTLVEDYNIRKVLKAQLYTAGVSKIEIERDSKVLRINIFCAKPGMVIGRQGAEIEKLRAQMAKQVNRPVEEVLINITEIKAPRENPQEATLALMNSGNGFNQFVDFSSMVYDNYPEVVIVCQTRGGKQLPKFAIQFNDGGGRIDKLTVQPDAIPLELTSEGLKIRKDNSVGSGTEDDFVTVNLYDFFKNAITGGGD